MSRGTMRMIRAPTIIDRLTVQRFMRCDVLSGGGGGGGGVVVVLNLALLQLLQ